MIIDRLHGTECKQEDGLSEGEVGNGLRYYGTNAVEQKSFERVIVKCTERVGYIEPVVHGMQVFVEELVRMHPAVKEILPSVDDESFRHRIEPRTHLKKGEWTHSEKSSCAAGMPHQYNQCVTSAPRSSKK